MENEMDDKPIEPEARRDEREWVKTAIMMVEDGYPVPEVAHMLKLGKGVVRDALWPSRVREREGVRCSRCGRKMAYASEMAEPVCRACRKAHARRHDDKIIELWRKGLRADVIAARLEDEDMTALDVNHRVNNMRRWQGIELERRKDI